MDYTVSFIVGGLFFLEFEAIVTDIKSVDIKSFMQKEIKENKYLKINTESARKRVSQEIIRRVETTTEEFWIFYQQCSMEERKLLLFFLSLKTYQLLWDFHFKVTIPGFWAYHHQLDKYAYKMYLDELSSKDEKVSLWSETTKEKCVTNYVRMLRETGLIANGKIQRIDAEDTFYHYFIKTNESWALDAFLLDEERKKRISTYSE